MFGMSPSDSFLTLYVVSVGGLLLWRTFARDSKVTALRAEIAVLSGEVQRLSSRPGSTSTVKTPVVVIPREDTSLILSLDNTLAEFVPAFLDGPPYEEDPAPRMSGMIPVVIVNDEEDNEVPETLRSRVDPLVGADQAAE